MTTRRIRPTSCGEGLFARHVTAQDHRGDAVAGHRQQVVAVAQVMRAAEDDVGGVGVEM